MRLTGYIKLHRSLLEWRWWDDIPTFRVFVYLLLTARFTQSSWKNETLLPGQVVIGRKELAQKTGLSEQQTRTALKHLKTTGEITIKATNKYSVVTIEKWDAYQNDDATLTSKLTSNQPSSNQQITNNRPQRKNDNTEKKEKKGEKDIIPLQQYATYVRMTEKEHAQLVGEYGSSLTDKFIEILDNYKGASGKTYKSDYRAILNWVVKRTREDYPDMFRVVPRQNKPQTIKQGDENPFAEYARLFDESFDSSTMPIDSQSINPFMDEFND